MPAVRHCSRIDTFELKLQMERRLGSQKAEKYFNLLTRYLTLKLGKSEFDRVCVRLIGRENVSLHNELIKAILKNATVSKVPPPKQVKHEKPLTFKDPNGGLQSICRDAFPQSPRKGRTPSIRERKFKDRPSPLGLIDKNHTAEPMPTSRGQEQLLSFGSKPQIEVNSEQDALSPGIYKRIPITAPLGVNLYSKETRNVLHSDLGSAYYTETCHYSGQFHSTNSLENRLKQKLKMEGLDISIDCVNILNNGLDSYLKRLIKPSLELACSKSSHQPGKMFTTSLLDFRVATSTNPKTLGENWPIQLEKINLSAFEQSDGFDNK